MPERINSRRPFGVGREEGGEHRFIFVSALEGRIDEHETSPFLRRHEGPKSRVSVEKERLHARVALESGRLAPHRRPHAIRKTARDPSRARSFGREAASPDRAAAVPRRKDPAFRDSRRQQRARRFRPEREILETADALAPFAGALRLREERS